MTTRLLLKSDQSLPCRMRSPQHSADLTDQTLISLIQLIKEIHQKKKCETELFLDNRAGMKEKVRRSN